MPAASTRSTRARPTVLLVVAAGLLVARVALGVYEARVPAAAGGLVKWRRAEGAEISAAIEKKPILYDFSAAWCEPCRQMEHEVFADAAVADFINETYLPVRVPDEDRSATLAALRERYQVGGLPTLLIVHPGAGASRPLRTEGYAGKRRTMSFLKGAASSAQLDQAVR
jgi:thiol:disulfide interchange protein DsbD